MAKKWIALTLIVAIAAGFAGYALCAKNNNNSSSTSSTQIPSSSSTADYSGRGLTKFPTDALSRTNTTRLILSNNMLTGSLPGEIRLLTNLEELRVDNNRMTGIPAEIGKLKNLKILNYNNNKITGLPLELGKLTQLEVLDLSGNNVSQQDIAQIKAKLINTQIKL